MKRHLPFWFAILLIAGFSSTPVLAQPGTNCANPFTISSLPFVQTGMTTCGFGDNYNSGDACGSSYLNGDDFVFEYNSPGNEVISISLTNTGTWVGVFVMDGCPDAAGTNCITPGGGATGGACTAGGGGPNNTNSGGNPSDTWTLTNSGIYYIVVSTFPAPQCTPFDISITSMAPVGGGSGTYSGCYSLTQSIPYNPEPYNQGTTVTFPDDEFSNVLPVGFDFCYMGINYNQFVISSNGYVSFSTACAGDFSTWITAAIPTTSPDEAMNAIMGPWQDIDPSVAGNLRYSTQGTAPNRRLVVNFQNVAMFDCNSQLFTGQIILYEGTNVIENFIQNKTICTTWNSGNAVHGLHDHTGTVAYLVPGRNNTQWITTNEGIRWTPTCPPCITLLHASYRDFNGIPTEEGNLIEWETLREEDLDRFVLERSFNGTDFEALGSQKAYGNSNQGSTYQMEDLVPWPLTYYRLKEVSQNGETSYSHVITVTSDAQSSPFQNFYVDRAQEEMVINLDLTIPSQGLQVRLQDAMGRVVMAKQYALETGQHELRFPMQALASGTYVLQLQDGALYRDAQRVWIP